VIDRQLNLRSRAGGSGQFAFAFFAVRREIPSKTAKDAKPDRKVSQRKRFWFSS
jgi:hypothetical protein